MTDDTDTGMQYPDKLTDEEMRAALEGRTAVIARQFGPDDPLFIYKTGGPVYHYRTGEQVDGHKLALPGEEFREFAARVGAGLCEAIGDDHFRFEAQSIDERGIFQISLRPETPPAQGGETEEGGEGPQAGPEVQTDRAGDRDPAADAKGDPEAKTDDPDKAEDKAGDDGSDKGEEETGDDLRDPAEEDEGDIETETLTLLEQLDFIPVPPVIEQEDLEAAGLAEGPRFTHSEALLGALVAANAVSPEFQATEDLGEALYEFGARQGFPVPESFYRQAVELTERSLGDFAELPLEVKNWFMVFSLTAKGLHQTAGQEKSDFIGKLTTLQREIEQKALQRKLADRKAKRTDRKKARPAALKRAAKAWEVQQRKNEKEAARARASKQRV